MSLSRNMDYLTYIIAGIRNKPGRNLATIFCFAIIASTIFSGQYLMAGASGTVEQGVSRMGADLILVSPVYVVLLQGAGPGNTMAIIRVEPATSRISMTALDTVGSVNEVTAMSPQLYVATLVLPELSSSPVDIYGFDPETDFTIQPWLQAPLKAQQGPGEVIVGSGISGLVSSEISISGSPYTIVGRLDPTRSPIDHTIFLRMDDAYALAAKEGVVPPSSPRIAPGDINAVLIRIGPEPAWYAQNPGTLDFKPSYPDYVSDVIRRQFTSTYATVIRRHFSLSPVSGEVSAIPGLLGIISGVVVVAAFPLIALIAAMVAHERQREIGLLRSMGAKRRIIAFLVIAESLFLAVAGGIAGVAASIIVFALLNMHGLLASTLQVSFRMPGLTGSGTIAGTALVAVIAIGSIAGLYPAYQSSRMNPYEAIHREGM